jgi:ankyrin repeat protein
LPKLLKFLQETQVNANDNKSGSTPLHWAAAHGSKNVAEPLIAKGADVNAEDNSSKTLLYYAIKRYKKSSERYQEMYQYLSLLHPDEKQQIVKQPKESTEIVKLLKNSGGRE